VASRWPAALERGRSESRRWRSWLYESRLGGWWPREPDGDEVARDCFALPVLRLVFPVPAGGLPVVPCPPHARGEVELAARGAVAVLVDELNQITGPVLAALEGSVLDERLVDLRLAWLGHGQDRRSQQPSGY